MALDAPPLALHDIIHTLSPSPTPEAQATSPEPLTDVDITRMRRRVQEMGLSQKDAQNPSSREQELADMVLRLTESTLMESTQLVRQAETIAGLMLQRDYLVVQVEEERARWESEKEGWARMAEALIAQRNRPGGNATRDPELERHFSAFESDNRALREKLHDTQTRLQTLEAELTKLRPILLMQPFPSTTSQSTLASISHASTFLSSVPYPSLSPAPSNAKIKLKKKKKESRVAVYSTTQDGQEAIVLKDDSNQNVRLGVDGSTGSFSQFQAHPAPNAGTQPVLFSGDHYRKPTVRLQGGPLTTPPTTMQFQVDPPAQPQPGSSQQLPTTSTGLNPSTPTQPPATPKQPPKPKKNNTGSAPLIPLTSDARSEHLLLAARKIGRERAGIVAGFIKDRQREMDAQKAEKMEKERERRERVGGGERGGGLSYYRKDSVGGSPTTPKMVRVIGTPGAPAVSGMGGLHYPNFPALAPGVSPRGQGQGKGQGLVSGFNYDAPPVPARPLTAGSSGNYPQPSTPRQAAAAIQQGQSQQAQGGPSTPLASLLDAARMMDDDAASGDGNGNGNENGSRNGQEVQNMEDETTAAGVRRDASLLEDPESPQPKRRRLGTGTNGGDAEGNEDSLGRVRSALDVLADQAAAFSSADRRAGKGKARETGGKEVLAPEAVVAPAKGRGRGKAKVREKEKGKEREREKEKEKQDKTDTPPVLTGRKPRVRAPPKPRRLVPAPPAVASLPTPTSAKGKEKAGTAVPRLISPPGPKSSSVGASPLDRVSGAGLKRSGGDGHGLRKGGGGGGGTMASREGSQFGFRPVSWARPGEEEEGSLPVVDVRELRRKRREENNALMVDNSMVVDEAESLVVEESVPSGPGKDGKERENENENENEVEDNPVVPPPGPTSPIPSLAVVIESAEVVEVQTESIVLRDELVENTEQVKKPPDGEDAEMDDLQATTIEQAPQIEHPPEEVQTKERLPSPPEIDTTPLKEGSPSEEQTPKDSNGSPQSQSIGEVSQIQLGIADQEISNDDEPRGVEDERMVEPMPTTQEQARLSPLHPTTPPLAGLNIDHLQRIVLDADAEADTDPDLDADGDADADGEADAEGEADVDAEGEIDPDVELIVAHDEVQESGNSPRENGLYPASIPDVSSQDPLASGSSMLSTSESIDSYSKATAKLTSQDLLAMVPDKRPRSPYVKWTKEEDELLAEAVNKHGHKWDLVQKALPSRGYHQVRQRWLRRLGLLDNKQGPPSFHAGGSAGQGTPPIGGNEMAQTDPVPKPKLGMAPLSSELAYSVLGRSSSSGIDPG